jgi:hypothetical protein
MTIAKCHLLTTARRTDEGRGKKVSGRIVNSSFLWAWVRKQTLWDDQKLEEFLFNFLEVSDQKEHILAIFNIFHFQ